jgi:hypothetical protein
VEACGDSRLAESSQQIGFASINRLRREVYSALRASPLALLGAALRGALGAFFGAKRRSPAPIKVGFRSVRWKLSEVLAWRAKISNREESLL